MVWQSKKLIADLAYAAGIIDGEGSISASRSKQSPKSVRVLVSVGMCDREAVDLLARCLGGSVFVQKKKTKSGKTIYGWRLGSKKAARALSLLLPYLLIKKERAKDAIILAMMMKSRRAASVTKITSEEEADRLLLFTRIKKENNKTDAVKSNAAA